MILYKSIAFVKDYYAGLRAKARHTYITGVPSRLPEHMKGSSPVKSKKKKKSKKGSKFSTPNKTNSKVNYLMQSGSTLRSPLASTMKSPQVAKVEMRSPPKSAYGKRSEKFKHLEDEDFINSLASSHAKNKRTAGENEIEHMIKEKHPRDQVIDVGKVINEIKEEQTHQHIEDPHKGLPRQSHHKAYELSRGHDDSPSHLLHTREEKEHVLETV